MKIVRVCKYSTVSVSTNMKAWEIYNYGNICNLRKSESLVTPPITSPNQILVKVNSVSLNPIDLKLIQGYGSSLFKMINKFSNKSEFPLRLGRDFSGRIVKVGRSVSKWKVNTDVIGALWPFEIGSIADYVVCCESQLALKPKKLTFDESASIPYAGLTAVSGLTDFGNLKSEDAADKKVLIIGGNGGVGTIAIQIAKYYGAYVAVMCNKNANDLMMNLGADAVHGTSNYIGTKYDLILDCSGGNNKSTEFFGLLKPGCDSRYVTLHHPMMRFIDQYGSFVGLNLAVADFSRRFLMNAFSNSGSLYWWGFFRTSEFNLSFLSNLVDQGYLKPVVDSVYTFNRVPEAFERLKQGGLKGKVVISIQDDGESSEHQDQ